MISVVIPVFNEQDSVESLTREVSKVAEGVPISEIVYVNDASKDKTLEALKNLRREFPFIRIVDHQVQSGQSAAMWSGVQASKGPLIVFLDGDGQNDPADIPKLYQAYEAQKGIDGHILIAGQRLKRQDSLLKKFSSRTANKIRAAILKDRTCDTGCSLKMMLREDYLRLPYFNHMHRYIPALMLRNGVRLYHVDVSHRHRTRGVSKYGFWDRLAAGVVDLLCVAWLLKRARPQGFEVKEIV